MQVRTGALGTPLEGAVVHELASHRVGAVTQRLGLERPDHLRVAVVAAFAHVYITPRQLQRGIGFETLHRLGGGLLKEQGNDFHQTTHGHHEGDQDDHQKVAGLDPGVTGDVLIVGHVVLLLKRGLG